MLGLTACGSPVSAPEPSGTREPAPVPSETQEPVEEPTEVTLTINADYLTISFEDGETTDYPYLDSPVEVIDVLNDIYGIEPQSAYSGEQSCYGNITSLTWVDFSVNFDGTDAKAATDFQVASSNRVGDIEKTPTVIPDTSIYIIDAQSTHGAAIGSPVDEFRAIVPEAPYQSYDYEGINYEYLMDGESSSAPFEPEEGNYYGVLVFAEDGAVTGVVAPTYFVDNC